MDFIIFILFGVAMVMRAMNESKRKQEQHKRAAREYSEVERTSKKIDLPESEKGTGTFGGPWNLPLPGFPVEETSERHIEVEERTHRDMFEKEVSRKAEILAEGEGTEGGRFKKDYRFMGGMGVEGSRSTEGPADRKRSKRAMETMPEKAVTGFELSDVARGVIMAEILGPPRAKQRNIR